VDWNNFLNCERSGFTEFEKCHSSVLQLLISWKNIWTNNLGSFY